MSFPARVLHERRLLHGRVLDFGCGFGVDVRELQRRGIQIEGYDRFHAPTYPVGQFDTILCLYVLNVLLPEEQGAVLQTVRNLLAPGGTAYFAVRRDVRYQGFRMHRLHGKRTYQCDVHLDLPSLLCNAYCEIYALKASDPPSLPTESSAQSQSSHDSPPGGKALWPTHPCPFCLPNLDREIIAETPMAYAVYDRYPVSPGHALVIPKAHAASYFDLSMHVQHSCWFLLNHVRDLLQERYQPDGFTVGINVGEAAGQTVMHVHIHLIPRYVGDVEDARGGVRGVVGGRIKGQNL